MARVALNHGYLDADRARRFIPDPFWEKLPTDCSEVALVEIRDSTSGASSTIVGDARLFRSELAKLDAARELGDDALVQHLGTTNLAEICPIERTGWLADWITDLQQILDSLPASHAGPHERG